MIRAEAGIAALCVIALAGASCVRRPPRPFTGAPSPPVISLHGFFGNLGYLDLAERLLDKSKGSPLPGDWTTAIPLKDYCGAHLPLYVDKDQGGQDNDKQKGLEASTLAFYAGHGHDIDGWFVPNPLISNDEPVLLDSVRVGDLDLRYFWLYSCQVLAHGPKSVGNGINYSAPQCFRPGDADVFERWTGSFACGMRLVCGGSTNLGHAGVDEIWRYLLESETSVADAWILGLANPKEVPVCLARGGRDQISSALADRALQTEKIAEGGWLHFQYTVKCSVTRALTGSTLYVSCNQPSVSMAGEAAVCGAPVEPAPPAPESPAPTQLPKVKTLSLPAPAPTAASLPLGFVRLAGHDDWKYQPDSGGFVVAKSHEAPDRYDPLASCDRETHWLVDPAELLARKGLDLTVFASDPASDPLQGFSFTAWEMRVESRRDGARKGSCAVRSLFLLLRPSVDIGTSTNPKRYPIFGPAVVFELQRKGNEDPVLASFSAPRRQRTVLSGEPQESTRSFLRTASAAINEAHEELQLKAEEYPIENAKATLGYEEAPLRCQQRFLRPTYEIQFIPTDAVRPNRATVTVRKDARLNPVDEAWTCKGWGDFPPP
jgi:hypothetical protein